MQFLGDMVKCNYFPHDSNARNDERILKLRMKLGAAGYGIYFMLLEKFREENEYSLVKNYDALSFELRVKKSAIKSVVEDFGLFETDEKTGRFYSVSFRNRMEIMDEQKKKRADAGRKGGKATADRRLETDKQCSSNAQAMPQKNEAMLQQCSSDAQAIKENKIKENKINNPPISPERDEYDLLLDELMKPEESATLEQYCMSEKISMANFVKFAKDVISEWKLTKPAHKDKADARRHLVNQIRKKNIYASTKQSPRADRRCDLEINATAEDYASTF